MTLEKLLGALATARTNTADDPGLRVEEVKDATGLSRERINSLIRAGLAAGTVRRSSRMFERTDGRMTPVTTYVFLDGFSPWA